MTDRARNALESMLVGIWPSVALRLVGRLVRWRYKVTAVSPGPPVLISGTPAGRSPYGDLANIQLWPGPSGAYAVPPVGSTVLVAFNEMNGTEPCVVALDPSTPPTLTTLGGGTLGVAIGPDVATELGKIHTALSTHVHGGVQAGGATSGAAASVYTPGTVTSTKVVTS